jgi:hypothetical protein
VQMEKGVDDVGNRRGWQHQETMPMSSQGVTSHTALLQCLELQSPKRVAEPAAVIPKIVHADFSKFQMRSRSSMIILKCNFTLQFTSEPELIIYPRGARD